MTEAASWKCDICGLLNLEQRDSCQACFNGKVKNNQDQTETKQEKNNNIFDTSTVQLNDGNVMPTLGFGTYELRGKTAINCTEHAINIGYEHIDTAMYYNNEREIGEAIKNSEMDRKQLFITSKLMSSAHETGKGETKNAVIQSLNKLNTSYIDLYLIHSPFGGNNIKTYKSLLKMKENGYIKSVGVSNYGIKHLKALENAGLALPVTNQIEFHPWLQQTNIYNYCKSKGIIITAYSPLTKGKKLKRIHRSDALYRMSHKYSASIAQILIRWNLHQNNIVIVKSSHYDRIEENFDMFNWEIDENDLEVLQMYDENYHCTWDPTKSSMSSF